MPLFKYFMYISTFNSHNHPGAKHTITIPFTKEETVEAKWIFQDHMTGKSWNKNLPQLISKINAPLSNEEYLGLSLGNQESIQICACLN